MAGLPLELVLHNVRTFGVRSVGPRAGGAVLLMLLFVAFHPGENVRPLTCFTIAVIPLSITAQIIATVRHWRGEQMHSRYNGTPYAMWLLPRWSEVAIKRLEPFIALIVGCGIHHFNHPLGAFVITAAISLGIRVGIEHRGNWTRSMDMNDAIIEQTMAMEDAHKLQRR
jgi:hypothetical protein